MPRLSERVAGNCFLFGMKSRPGPVYRGKVGFSDQVRPPVFQLQPLPVLPVGGDPAPGFVQRTHANPRFSFDSAAGRYLVLGFAGSGGDPAVQRAMRAIMARRDLFDDEHASFFAVTQDPQDEAQGRLADRLPGCRIFWDFDHRIARRYRLIDRHVQGADPRALPRFWLVIDPTMRVIENIPFAPDGSDVIRLLDLVAGLPPPGGFAGVPLQAPILFLPRVFEPELCRHLIALYYRHGGEESGFMRQEGARTVAASDARFKRRKDYVIRDTELIAQIQARFVRRVIPEIAKAHHFAATRMERYIVSCYDARDGGHFAAHRDNTTTGTAHRRFAVSINLNDDFQGGEVGFPEYGPRSFKAPAGGAVVFSCSLLHRVGQVTAGRRFAFLPFLYDEAAAKIRETNAQSVGAAGAGPQRAVP